MILWCALYPHSQLCLGCMGGIKKALLYHRDTCFLEAVRLGKSQHVIPKSQGTFYYFFWGVLGVEAKVSPMLGKCSATEQHPGLHLLLTHLSLLLLEGVGTHTPLPQS